MPKPNILYNCEDCGGVFESFEDLIRCQYAHDQQRTTKEVPMHFPLDHYNRVVDEARAIIVDRDQRGRNNVVPFYDGFPHGHVDVSFELSRRVGRILGAEKVGKLEVAREDALDLLNYAAFYVMLLDRETTSGGDASPAMPADQPMRHLRSI